MLFDAILGARSIDATFYLHQSTLVTDRHVAPLIAFAAIYIAAGLLCGAHIGAVLAIRDKTPDLMKVCDTLAMPLIRAIVANVPLDQSMDRGAVLDTVAHLQASLQKPAAGSSAN